MNTFVNTRENRNKRADEELLELEAANKPVDNTNPPVEHKEDDSWKQRYSDLRSYAQKEKNGLENRIKELENKKEAPKLPTTPEELDAWKREFPDAVRNIQALVMQEISTAGVSTDVTVLKDKIDSLEYDLRKERGISKLLQKHSDFYEVIGDEKFHLWLDEQRTSRGRIGQAIWDSMNSDELDADAASDTISQYKQGNKTVKKPDTREQALGFNTLRSAPKTQDGKKTYTEDEIGAMSDSEFSKHEADIDLARREGRIFTQRYGAAL